jgi:hypothetical protein
MSDSDSQISFVVCSVLAAEVRQLVAEHWPQARIVLLDSMLHMHPDQLTEKLGPAVSAELASGYRVVLVYGDCHACMSELEKRPGVARVKGINCNALLLGREVCRQLLREGAFFMLPEWLVRWREVFSSELGLNRSNASGLMGDSHRKLIYLDTGIVPVPQAEMEACAEYCALPWEIRPVSLAPLRAALAEAVERVSANQNQP